MGSVISYVVPNRSISARPGLGERLEELRPGAVGVDRGRAPRFALADDLGCLRTQSLAVASRQGWRDSFRCLHLLSIEEGRQKPFAASVLRTAEWLSGAFGPKAIKISDWIHVDSGRVARGSRWGHSWVVPSCRRASRHVQIVWKKMDLWLSMKSKLKIISFLRISSTSFPVSCVLDLLLSWLGLSPRGFTIHLYGAGFDSLVNR